MKTVKLFAELAPEESTEVTASVIVPLTPKLLIIPPCWNPAPPNKTFAESGNPVSTAPTIASAGVSGRPPEIRTGSPTL